MICTRTLSELCATNRLTRIWICLLGGTCPNRAANLWWWQWLTWWNTLSLHSEQIILLLDCLRKLHDVVLGLTSNMGNGILHDFDATLPIVGNNIAPNIWLAMRSKNNNTIESTLLYFVSPNQRHRPCFVIITDNLNAILMGL